MKETPKNEKIGGWAGIIISIIVFQSIAPSLFASPSLESGLNLTRTLFAAITGVVGYYLGVYVAKFLGKKS